MSHFKLISKFKPTGDQPRAIKQLTKNLKTGAKDQVLLGVTGSGKTFTLANIIANTQKPTLIISHNKTLAAQLYQEFKEFFPKNAVHYFVSYYDYYQPEAYIPQTDTYIEKDAKINEQIDRLRHAAVQDLSQRKDVIVVASVSCIYGLGNPAQYQKIALEIRQGQKITRKDFLSRLVDLQYQRNDYEFKPGTFRTRGDVIEIFAITGEKIVKVEFFGNQIEKIWQSNMAGKNFLNLNLKSKILNLKLFPANFWASEEGKMKIAMENIKTELMERLKDLNKQNKLLEAQRLEQRTNYDLEMLAQAGVCSGIENYSRHLEFRKHGTPPFTLLDYFSVRHVSDTSLTPSYLTIIDESHMTIPQLHAMYNTDKARKNVLIEHGFRLPSALDNRPLSFDEFEKKAGQVIYSSATPGEYEINKIRNSNIKIRNKFKIQNSKFQTPKNPVQSRILRQDTDHRLQTNKLLVEQLIRPTGLLEPTIEIRPIANQVRDLIAEIKKRAEKNQRTLAITLTKRLAEELAEYLSQEGVKAKYLHSEVKTLERPEILKDFRQGKFDVIVGINLLREGLDLPEVSLIGILDADKEGFLRNETTLIQTMGRAARHPEGHVILYADKITGSIKSAIKETERRRKIQVSYNKKYNITPMPIIKPVREWGFGKAKENPVLAEFGLVKDIKLLEKEMKKAAQNLDFERAAEIRDLIKKLKT